jgi:hypothetical protein
MIRRRWLVLGAVAVLVAVGIGTWFWYAGRPALALARAALAIRSGDVAEISRYVDLDGLARALVEDAARHLARTPAGTGAEAEPLGRRTATLFAHARPADVHAALDGYVRFGLFDYRHAGFDPQAWPALLRAFREVRAHHGLRFGGVSQLHHDDDHATVGLTLRRRHLDPVVLKIGLRGGDHGWRVASLENFYPLLDELDSRR